MTVTETQSASVVVSYVTAVCFLRFLCHLHHLSRLELLSQSSAHANAATVLQQSCIHINNIVILAIINIITLVDIKFDFHVNHVDTRCRGHEQ